MHQKTPVSWWDELWDWLTDNAGGGSANNSNAGCSGHAKNYPAGFTFVAIYKFTTGERSTCEAQVYFPDGSLDEDLGDGDCEMLCSNNVD